VSVTGECSSTSWALSPVLFSVRPPIGGARKVSSVFANVTENKGKYKASASRWVGSMTVGLEGIRGQGLNNSILVDPATMPGPDETHRHSRDTAFGPPSDPVDIHDFIQNVGTIKADTLNRLRAGWQSIPDDDRRHVEEELR
jgi:hypothetical protein